MINQKILELSRLGLIPGPGETLQEFNKRVEYCLHLQDHLPNDLKSCLSDISTHTYQEPEIINEAADVLKKNYDCSPVWTPLFFSNYKLPFWQGGCAWIFQMDEDTPTAAFIQLRRAFIKSPTHLGIYDRKELLTHELSHTGRMMFQEPKFEELLAYNTAKSPFRRWFGPLVQSSAESALFMLIIFMLVVFDAFLIASNHSEAYMLALWLKLIPLGIVIAALVRLYRRHRTFALCVERLGECVGIDQAKAVAYRLKDDEIVLFSKVSKEEIREYAIHQAEVELRWKVILATYFEMR